MKPSLSPNQRAVVGGAAAAVVVVSVAFLFQHRARGGSPSEGAMPAATDAVDADAHLVAWCAEGLEPIAGGGCFAGASVGATEPRMLVYLHGMYTPAGAPEELDRQSRVAKAAIASGFSVLALRGNQGQCATIPDYWCWPSNERTADAGATFVSTWSTALEAAEARGRPGKRYLLGFSNGGYFAALIASRALMPFDAIAIAHAGPVAPVGPQGPRTPLLLLTADSDPSVTSMMLLDAELTSADWPHAIVTRDGGHGLTDGDVATALTFFLRTQHETLPFKPPLSVRLPVPNLPDATSPAESPAGAVPALDNVE